MNFKEKVQSMSATEIILAMVEGLESPTTILNMKTYGTCEGGKCYGCAATNTITKIHGKPFPAKRLDARLSRSIFLHVDYDFLENFECAINELRQGFIYAYNAMASASGFATVKDNFNENLAEIILDSDPEQWKLDAWRFVAFSQ